MEKRQNPQILIIGEAIAPTGFARVIRSIFTPLKDDYDLHQLATRCGSDPNDYPWPLYPAITGGDSYGYALLPNLLKKLYPDIIFILYDLTFQAQYMSILRELSEAKIIIYSPVEAGPISPELIEQISGVSRYVAFTNYGRTEIEASVAQLQTREQISYFPAVNVIPHGIDTDAFYPLNRDDPRTSQIQARTSLGIYEPYQVDDFIVLNANRNMPRKRIDLTMQGFAQFAAGKPTNVKLYLHMGTEDAGWNVLLLARRYKIEDRLIMTRADNVNPTLSDEQMNLIYNACDVGITTTMGEGWGMVAFEHAATRAAQIVPNHTSLTELWNGCAEFIEPFAKFTWPGNLTEGHMVSADDVALALERVYADKTYRDVLSQAAFDNATKPEYQWTSIAKQWDILFREMII